MKNVIEEHFREHVENSMREPLLFGDYRTALDEGEARLYEDIQDYDAAKALFQEVSIRTVHELLRAHVFRSLFNNGTFGMFKGAVSSRSVQSFDRAWNRCPSLR